MNPIPHRSLHFIAVPPHPYPNHGPMTLRVPLFSTPLLAFFILLGGNAVAQCTNTSLYPSNPVTPNANGTVTTITTCNYQTEYARITGIVVGASYRFTIEDNSHVTVRKGTFNGPVVGFGLSPLTITDATGEDLYVHWNTNSACGTATTCLATTVQRLIDCDAPQFVWSIDNDCVNQQYFIEVQVIDLGDAPSVSLQYAINGGGTVTLSGLQVGTHVLGPFANLAVVDLVVVHPVEPACNSAVNDITNGPCPLISCGPDTYTYCYGNNANYQQTYQADAAFPLRLQFNSGAVSGSGNDALVIHDGLDVSGPVLFSGVGNNGNLAGVTVTSTNPDHALTLAFTSNGSFSCADGGVVTPWNYTVGCLDCTPPVGIAGPVTTDCDAQSYTVQVNVLNMGSADQVQITNSIGEPELTVSSTGSYTAGPFPLGAPVELSLVNLQSTICFLELGSFDHSFCAIDVACGQAAVQGTYCYGENDAQAWLYQNTGTEPLALLFSAGGIESAVYDNLTIYDGVDNTAPVIWNHVGNTASLAGVLAISTGPALYMEMSSDNSISCQAGSFGITTWQWTVGCLDCTPPQATYAVQLDCDNDQFFIATNITDMGSDGSIQITNTGGAPVINVSAPGEYLSGPFQLGATVSVDVVSDENVLCNVGSEPLTSAPCPLIGCGPYNFDLCYPDEMDTVMVYQSSGTFPIAVLFTGGELETSGDLIQVYDGPDLQSPLIYSGSNGGDLTGLLFTSTNTGNVLCIRFLSDFFDSCEDGGSNTPWTWTVSCLDCTNPAATFNIVPNCIQHTYDVEVDVTSLGTGSTVRIANTWTGDTLSGFGLGTTMVPSIPVDQEVQVAVLNDTNPLCRSISPVFNFSSEDCIVTACEATGVEYCYANADTAWFSYRSGTTAPITISFAYGQVLAGDVIQLFNGPDAGSQLVYEGNAGGQLGGLALASSNPDNALTLRVISNGSGSCSTGEASPGMYWSVGCGLVGLDEVQATSYALRPNPASDLVHLDIRGADLTSSAITLLDMAGRPVLTESLSKVGEASWTFDVSAVPAGFYLVRVRRGGMAHTMRLEVVR